MSASVSGAYASAHLPECTLPKGWGDCICGELRACEQRVFQEQIKGRQHDMVMAYLRGLDAAREAVADLTPFVFAYQTWISGDYGYDEGPWVKKENALAAIDALLEEKE